MEKRLLLISLFLGVHIIRSVNSVCTLSDFNRAWSCTGLSASLLHTADAKYAQIALDLCRPQRSQDTTDCIEDVRNSNNCSKDEGFARFVKTDMHSEVIDYFCNSHSEHNLDDASCISHAYEGVEACSQETLERLTSMQKLFPPLMDALIETCRYIKVASDCHLDLIKAQCATAAADFASNYYTRQNGFCKTDDTESMTSTSKPDTGGGKAAVLQSTILVFLLLSFVILSL